MATHRLGRVSKLTPAVQEHICRAVEAGLSLVEAAALMGIAKATVLQWLQRGRGEHGLPATQSYIDFLDAVTRAQAADIARRVARIEAAGRGGAVVVRKITTYPDGRVVTDEEVAPPDWRADAWHLERHYQDTWGRRTSLDLRVSIEAAAAKVAAELGLTPDEVLAEAQLLLKEMDRGDVGPPAG